MNRFISICTASLLLVAMTGRAQVLDNTFGTNGLVTVTPQVGEAIALARQADGKIITVGRIIGNAVHNFQIIRYNNDGSLDNGFGIGGMVITEVSFLSMASAVVIQPDGKIIVGGTYHTGDFANIYHMAVARYHTDGSIDSTFGTNGLAMPEPGFSEEIHDMVLQPDGKIIAGGAIVAGMPTGAESFMLARLNSDGSLDNGFGTSGVTITAPDISSEIMDIALLPDGKIIAAGTASLYDDPPEPDYTNFAIARYTSQGILDNAFGTNGIVTTDVVAGSPDLLHAMVVQPDGKIVAAGSNGGNHYLVRYQVNGSLDNTFGTSGKAIRTATTAVLRLALRNNGKFITAGATILSGSSSDFIMNGYLQNGAIDTDFGTNGTVRTNFPSIIPEGKNDLSNCILLAPEGKIVVAGSSDMNVAVARYTINEETGINNTLIQGLEISPNPFQNTMNLQWSGAGKIMNAELYLVNMLGQRVFSNTVSLTKGNNKIDIPNLAPGNYILCIAADNGKTLQRKVTKK